MLAKRHLLPPSVDVPRAMTARSFREFDDAVTAPLHGFTDAEDYYRRSSSGPYLDRIRVPTLLIHATDDPFLPLGRIPRTLVEDNAHLSALFTDRGGHVGFVAGRVPLRPKFWAERQAMAFIARHVAQTRTLTIDRVDPNKCGRGDEESP